MSKKRYTKTSKAFLAPHHDENSTVTWNVEVQDYQLGADVAIRDCYKRIDLNFWTDMGEYNIDARLLKISILIDELTLFRKALTVGHARYRLVKPLHDAKKKREKKKDD
jgi:hypothetical protein